jgi:chromosome partitioning protein
MAKVISMINLKGGVGKTSTIIALAEFLTYQQNKSVLVVDLDPQTNATVALIGEEEWKKRNNKGKTLLQLFKDKLDKTEKFSLTDSIVKNVSNINGGINKLDLLPSSLELIDIQDKLPLISAGRFFATSPVTILRDAISDIIEEYEYVLIDCPPNLGIITLNGILISNYFLIPSIPDILSTYGIPQILNRISDFANETNINIQPLGIIISMYRTNSRLHNTTIKVLNSKFASKEYPRIFNTIVPLSTKTAEASDHEATVNTIKQKYGYGGYFDVYDSLTKELLSYVD